MAEQEKEKIFQSVPNRVLFILETQSRVDALTQLDTSQFLEAFRTSLTLGQQSRRGGKNEQNFNAQNVKGEYPAPQADDSPAGTLANLYSVENVNSEFTPTAITMQVANGRYQYLFQVELKGSEDKSKPPADAETVKQSKTLLGRLAAAQGNPFYEMEIAETAVPIRMVMRDGLIGGSTNGGLTPTGGPGSMPRPVDMGGAAFITTSSPLTITHQLTSTAGTPTRSSEPPVDVYILDSAPAPEQIQDAHTRYQAGHHPDHPLYKLLGSTPVTLPIDVNPGTGHGAFKIIYADPASLPESGVKDHYNIIADHGLFIAGIIREIAPHANIFLIQILNKYAVGSLSTMIAGLAEVQALIGSRGNAERSVINCSLTMALPIDEHFDGWEDLAETFWYIRTGYFRDERLVIDGVFQGIQMVASNHSAILAAAGNDSDAPMLQGCLTQLVSLLMTGDLRKVITRILNGNRLPARLPAVLWSVTGIAAHTETGRWVQYSNDPDNPETDGIATFGGLPDVDELIGVFTAEHFPCDNPANDPYVAICPGAPNSSGLAYWSGTSFATAMISGAIADLCYREHITADIALGRVKTARNPGGFYAARQGS